MSLLVRLIFCLFVARQIMPIVSVITPPVVLIFMWAILGVSLLRYSILKTHVNRNLYIMLLIIILLINIIPFSADINLFGMRVYEHINIAILPSLTILYIINYRDIKLCRSLCFCLYISLLITTITTIYGNMLFPNASRMMATGMADNPALLNQYYRYNIGGFDFIYSIALLIPIMIYVIKNYRKYRYQLFLLLFTSLYSILISEYTTALLISLIGLSCFFMSSTITKKCLKSYFVVVVIIIALFYTIIPTILNYIADMVGSEEIAIRLHDISDTIMGNEVDDNSDISSRQNLYMDSITGFIENPIWGIQTIRGGHSFTLGVICYWGIFGGLMFFYMLNNISKLFLKPFMKTSIYGHMCIFYALYIIVLTLNPRTYFIVPMFCVPIVAFYFSYKNLVSNSIRI